MVREVRRVGSVPEARSGALPGHVTVLSIGDLQLIAEAESVEKKIQFYIELAVRRCGSAAALARELGVKPPTVSQWRSGLKNPDAANLIRIQDIVFGAHTGKI